MTEPSERRRALSDVPGCVSAGPYSLAVQTSAATWFTSGQIGLDAVTGVLAPGGFEAELSQIFRNFAVLLDAACLDFDDVVKCTVYLTDVADFAKLNTIYALHFEKPFPARTTIGVAALPLGASVEIEMIVAPR